MLERAFEFKHSNLYLILIISVLLLSIVIMLLLPIALWLRCLGFLFLSCYGAKLIGCNVLRKNPQAILGIKHETGNNWWVTTRAGIYPAEIVGDSTVTGFVSILRFKVAKQRFIKTCIVFRDSLPAGMYRKLLVTLRMG